MTEVVLAIGAKVLEYSVGPAIDIGYCLFCGGKLVKKLEKEKNKLTSKKDDVSQRAKEAEKKTEKIETAVEKWLQEVQSLLQDVESLEKEVKANGCFWNLCPPWRRYHFGKQLAKKIERMIELNNNSNSERFSRLVSLPTNVEYFSSANFMLFESTKLAYDQLMEAIKDDGCYMICLHGMGGCGKTTLAKEMGKRAKELNLFDKVVFTTVSQSIDVRRIQGDIADELGLSPLTEEGNDGRARRLSLRLRSGERILVILDDVWRMLNLEDFGIPIDGNHKGCKVLLTTRRQQLCSLMNGQRNIPLHLLSEHEAWAMFQKKACIDDESSLFDRVARDVVAECKGLPIAIQAVITTLKGKPLDSWKDALYKLRHSKPVVVDEDVIDAFTCLQYSYDVLKSDEAKNLFLICSIFPEDHEIEIEDLFKYGVGLGLFGEAGSFDDLRSRVNAILTNLLEHSLLMRGGREHCVKIHDVVRDFALWKLSEEKTCSVVVDHVNGINSLALNGLAKNCVAISAWYHGMDDQFPQQLDSPKLEILLWNSMAPLDLSQASFKGIQQLKVMGLINLYYGFRRKIRVSLPQSIEWLTNIRTLRLVRCDLGDISFVVCLKGLEILDLHGSNFKLLPKGIEELNKLKLLDLGDCKINENCDEVIRRCSHLEELYVYGVEAFSGKYMLDCQTCLSGDVFFSNLQRYILKMGKVQYRHARVSYSGSRVLHLGGENISTLSRVVKDLVQRAEEVYLECLNVGCKSFFPEIVATVESMNQLITLDLYSCSNIESLLYSTPTEAYCSRASLLLLMLVKLRLYDVDNLKQVCHGPLPSNVFQNLKEVEIYNCCKLTSIFPEECNMCHLEQLSISRCPTLTSLLPMSVAQTLSQLEHITIKECSELMHIVTNEGRSVTGKGEEICRASNASDFMFPKLKTLVVRYCNKLQYALRIPSAQGPMQHLEVIEVHGCNELKFITFDEEEDGATTVEQKVHAFVKSPLGFPKLKDLHVSGCNKLEYVFPIHYAQGLVQLQNIWIKDAYQMKHVFGKHVADDLSANHSMIQIMFPQLTTINLMNLTSLVKICSENFFSSWPSLKEISWRDCPKLIILEVETTGRERSDEVLPVISNVELETLHMINCGVVNISFFHGDGLKNHQQELTTSKLKLINFKNLRSLSLLECKELKYVFPKFIHRSLPHLTCLDINNCENLEEIFAENEEHQTPYRVQECFPKLETIKVKGCPKLTFIVSTRMATSFPQLKLLSICEVSKLKEIFENTDEGVSKNEKEILVPNLRVMRLEKLPSLVDICLGFKFFPKEIDRVQVKDCPKFAGISEAARYWRTKGVRIAVLMDGSPLSSNEDPALPLSSLWSTELGSCGVMDIFQIDGSVCLSGDDNQQLVGSQVVRLGCDHELWRGPIPKNMVSPHYLQSLTVRRCGKLKCLLPMDVINERLPELVSLRISDCEELEHVIEERNVSCTQISRCFPKLKELIVKRCNKLKRIFPATMSGEKIVLSNLIFIELTYLPSLVGSRDEVQIPEFGGWVVWGCPNLRGS